MFKKLLSIVAATIFAVLFTACTAPVAPAGSTYVLATVTPAGHVATSAVSTPVPATSGCMSYDQLKALAPKDTDLYALIDALNANAGRINKQHHETGMWPVEPGDVIWTGLSYSPEDITLNGALKPIANDGYVGVYWVLNPVTIESPGAHSSCIPLDLTVSGVELKLAEECIDAAMLEAVVTLYKGQAVLINRLDEVVDSHPEVEVSGDAAKVDFELYAWTQQGSTEGGEVLAQQDGAEVVKGSGISFSHHFRGARVCVK